jgi:WD40 repeat protein
MKDNPYIGPRPYERQDAHNFYGRTREARDLVSLILANRVVLFYAQSGAGKTSLLNTQVIPALEEQGFNVLPVARVGRDLPPGIAPQDVPNIFVFSALMGLAGKTAPARQLTRHTLHLFLRQLLNIQQVSEALQASERDQDETITAVGIRRPPILIVDQFEEILTTHRDQWQDAQGFFEQLQEALRKIPELGVVLAMREDHIAGLDPYAPLLPKRLKTRFRMERLTVEGALEAAQKPALRAGVPFAPGVAEKLIDDLRRIKTLAAPAGPDGGKTEEGSAVLGPYVEPVQLQVVCSRLWDKLPEDVGESIDWEEIQRYGDIDRALTEFYESALAQAAQQTSVPEQQIRRWFGEQMVTPTGTRGLALRGESETAGLPNVAVDVLENRHIVRADERAGGRVYELVHDRLIDPILQSNREWEAARQTPLRLAAQRWKDTGRDPGILYRGKTLADALVWAQAHPSEVEPYEREFLEASQQAQARLDQERKRNRLIRLLAVTATVVSILAIVALAFAIYERGRANRQAGLAMIRQLVAQSVVAQDTYPQRSLLLALEAFRRTQEAGAPAHGESDYRLTAEDTLRRALVNAGGRVLSGHTGPVWSVAISPDNHWLATASNDKTARLWDLNNPSAAPLVLRGHEKDIRAVAFSPDSRWLVTGSDDATGRVWDVRAADPSAAPIVLRGHAKDIRTIAISSDSHWLVTGSNDKTARLWDLSNLAAAPIVLAGHTDTVLSVAISADRHWIATGGADQTVRVWDLDASDPASTAFVWRGHMDQVSLVGFSPDNRWLVSASVDATARLWDMTAPGPSTESIVLRGHEEQILSIAFSPDGEWLATGGFDTTTRLWDLDAPDPSEADIVLRGHTDQVYAAAFSSDNRWLVTASRDASARMWDLDAPDPSFAPVVLNGHESPIRALAISDDNRWLVTGGEDNMARLWGLTRPDSPAAPAILRGHTSLARIVAFSPDQHWLATGSGDGTVRLWDVQSPDPAAKSILLSSHKTAIYAMAISPNSRWLASGGQDNDLVLWDLTAQPGAIARPQILTGHTSTIRAIAFSPDNRWLISAGRDKTARLWNLENLAAAPIILRGHTDQIRVVAISPDGRWLVTGGDDGAPRLWNLSAPDPNAASIVLPGHTGAIRAVAFSADSRWLVTGGDDAKPRLWGLGESFTTTASVELPGHDKDKAIRAMAFTPDNRWLVTASADNTVRLWDMRASGKPMARFVLRGHNGEVRAIAISPDNHWLITGGEDDIARLWDLTAADPSAHSIILPGHTGPVWSVAFSPASQPLRVATGSGDNTARLWQPVTLTEVADLACLRAGRNLTTNEWKQFMGDAPYRKTCPALP